jgi:hypothetical protein
MISRWLNFFSPAFCEKHERTIVYFALALFLGFNLVTAPFSPDPWNDEVSYTDPAVTLATEGHLTSRAWGEQGKPVWTGNVPLHELLLAGVIKLFGFNYRTVRGVNMLYYTIAVFLIYQIVRKHGLIRNAGFRLLLVAVLLSGTGLVALYRNARYDAIGALLVAFWAWCSLQSGKKPAYLIGTFLAAILMPAASLSIAPLLILCGLMALYLWRWKSVYALGATGIGCILGMGIMQGVYAHFSVPHIFHAVMESSGGRDVTSDFILSVFENPSYIAAVAGGCLLVFPLRREPFQKDAFSKKVILALLFIAIVLPFLMGVVAKYHLYYTWMAIIPGSIGAFMALEFQSVPKPIRVLALAIILVATLPGFPRRCVRIAGSWAQHRPDEAVRIVQKNVSRTDTAFVNEGSVFVYYALRLYAREPFWLKLPTDETDKAAINVVFWPQAGQEKKMHDLFGGEWRETDFEKMGRDKMQLMGDASVQIAVYRRN